MLGRARRVPGPAAPAGRRRRARAAHAADLAAHQPRPARSRPTRAGGPRRAEARAELLDDVRAQIEEMTTLVGDLVELARDEPLPHVVEQVDLAEVVDRAVARVRRRAHRHHLRRRRRALVGDRRVRGPRACGDQPARQRREVEPARRHRHGPARPTATLTVDDQGPGIAAGRPAARLRPLLPLAGVALDARLRPRALDRAPGRAAALGHGAAPRLAPAAAPG